MKKGKLTNKIQLKNTEIAIFALYVARMASPKKIKFEV